MCVWIPERLMARPRVREGKQSTLLLLMMKGSSPHITRRIVAVRVSDIRMQSSMSLELLGTHI